ncbi:aldehyde dehydrogenase [Natrialba magadii ATCC 43099]|uniref:Aldehyde dehydrogenase n=1 Tax=Natrialba magadii (strain ATCC 43099 / DSM 3394 / CCM 3739 / CIP 104546 / IAM 13178 / JCM 8861 / NBRC 102185 / NCIMB 2190 / MS3) TaxID=547559 RepID=D3SW63_NATMM|nr:aldehyde dehydrogenase family protein [Natrialba magadii]ADD05724.1 aldehyde dehydrogenase [Natrialba magadii ATCC 43099]ELY29865.1 aldehyde dehydrogenase [Natrialba magadii ATCC 43099]
MTGTSKLPAEERAVTELAITPDNGWNALYLDGDWVPAGDRDLIDVENPATRSTVASVPSSTESDVDEAYAIATDAQSAWAERPPQERAAIVTEACELLGEYADDLATLFAVECGGVQLKADFELQLAQGTMEVGAGLAMRDGGRRKESVTPGKENLLVREPAGVVGVITPWNFPLYLSSRVVAPAIALGNSVVLKPDEHTPITGGLVLAKVFEEAGLPAGVLNVVPGYGHEMGDHFSGHSVPSVMSFTGSSEVGRGVGQRAVGSYTEPALELGGNNAHIVLSDADLERATDAGAFGSFTHQGQECISINRHLVHESLYDEYVAGLADRAAQLPIGDPREEGTLVGPVINESQRDKIVGFVDESVERGATVEAGGSHDGLFVEPTVLSNVTSDMPVACNEHFGPVAPVIPFETDEEAIRIANDTEYGLSGSVHSSDIARARDVADALETGMVHINDQPLNDEPHVAFGGVGASGMGRYNDEWIMDTLTTLKWISIQREPREYPY